MKSEKGMLQTAVWMALFIIVCAVAAYFNMFHKLRFSNDPEDWANFSDYINPFFYLASLPILAILSFMVYNAGIRKDEHDSKYREISERPIVSFKVNRRTSLWNIVNIGKGAAMNIVVAYSKDGTNWLYPVKCYSLEPNGTLEIHWHGPVYAWRAVYHDVFEDNFYTATCIGDETKITRGNGLGNRNDYVRLDEAEWQGPDLQIRVV